MGPPQVAMLLIAVLFMAMFLTGVFVFLRFGRLWLRAFLSGTPVPLMHVVGMALRRTDADKVINNLILARQSGVDISPTAMEQAYIQGVDIEKVTLAAIDAKRRGLDFSFEELVNTEIEGWLAEKLGRLA